MLTPSYPKAIAAMCAVAAGSLAVAATVPALAQSKTEYAQVLSNDMSLCTPGQGPAVRLQISGLRSGNGNLFVRTYKATGRDWLKSKRYLTRIDAAPRKGAMTICIPLPSSGQYAIAVQHDENGNRETDFSTDGAGITNNVKIKTFLGIPRPPSVSKAAFNAGSGVTRQSVTMRYRD